LADLIVRSEDIVALATALRAAQGRIEQARNRFQAASQVSSSLGRRDLEQQYDEAFRSMAHAMDQLMTSLGNGAQHFDKVAGNYSTTDSNQAARAASLRVS
jgi:uncharacterized protein YukE